MRQALAVAVLAAASAADADEQSRHSFVTGFDQAFALASSPLDSWVDGGPGKLRIDEEHDGVIVPRAFLDYRGWLTPTLLANATVNVNGDGDMEIGVTEAFLEHRPIPRSAWQRRWRFGAFYPRISLENADAGWNSPYTMSSSAINTWVGEELRTIGAELSLSRALPTTVPQRFGAQFAVYGANDVAGGLIAARGWAVHDRQTALFENVYGIEPFHELDGRAGYYLSADWRYGERARVLAFHYDNLADPEAVAGGQYGWRTYFDALGAQVALPGDLGLIVQWMDGVTIVGPWIDGRRAATDEFDASYVLLTRQFGAHRASLRYDYFNLDLDNPGGDIGLEQGHSWTAGYAFDFSNRLRLAAEWMRIDASHGDWMAYALYRAARESLARFDLRWRFGAGHGY
jgi:hypothetical protein